MWRNPLQLFVSELDQCLCEIAAAKSLPSIGKHEAVLVQFRTGLMADPASALRLVTSHLHKKVARCLSNSLMLLQQDVGAGCCKSLLSLNVAGVSTLVSLITLFLTLMAVVEDTDEEAEAAITASSCKELASTGEQSLQQKT